MAKITVEIDLQNIPAHHIATNDGWFTDKSRDFIIVDRANLMPYEDDANCFVFKLLDVKD